MAALTQATADAVASATNATTYDFGNQDIGAAPAAGERRFIILAVYGGINVVRTCSSVSVGGNAATKLHEFLAGATDLDSLSFWQIEIPTGSIAVNHTVVFSGGVGRAAFKSWRVISDLNGIVEIDYVEDDGAIGAETLVGLIDLVADGALLAYVKYAKSTATVDMRVTSAAKTTAVESGATIQCVVTDTPSSVWTGATEQDDISIEAATGGASGLIAISFGPVVPAGKPTHFMNYQRLRVA